MGRYVPGVGQLELLTADGEPVAHWRALFVEQLTVWAGQKVLGLVCPSCGALEPHAYAMVRNHELHPEYPGEIPPVCKVTRDRETGGSEIPRGGERDELRPDSR